MTVNRIRQIITKNGMLVNLTIRFSSPLSTSLSSHDDEQTDQDKAAAPPQVKRRFPPSQEVVSPQVEGASPQVEGGFPPSQEVVSPQVEGGFPPSQEALPPKSDDLSVQQKVLAFCREPRSLAEISEMLGLVNRKWVRDRYVTPLIGFGLKRVLPDKPNSRFQKYQTIE